MFGGVQISGLLDGGQISGLPGRDLFQLMLIGRLFSLRVSSSRFEYRLNVVLWSESDHNARGDCNAKTKIIL